MLEWGDNEEMLLQIMKVRPRVKMEVVQKRLGMFLQIW